MNTREHTVTIQVQNSSLLREGSVGAALRVDWRDAYRYWYWCRYFYFACGAHGGLLHAG